MKSFTILWLLWGIAGFILELAAIIHPGRGDTLSEQIWGLRGTGWFSLLIAFLLWTVFHFIWEGRHAR